MKKLLTLLFTFALVFSLSMPVFAQQAPAGQEAPKAEKAKEKKVKKTKKKKGAEPKAAQEAAPK